MKKEKHLLSTPKKSGSTNKDESPEGILKKGKQGAKSPMHKKQSDESSETNINVCHFPSEEENKDL